MRPDNNLRIARSTVFARMNARSRVTVQVNADIVAWGGIGLAMTTRYQSAANPDAVGALDPNELPGDIIRQLAEIAALAGQRPDHL